MKKTIILITAAVLSACTCFNPSDEENAEMEMTTAEQTATQTQTARRVVVAEQPDENIRVVRRRVRRVYYRDSVPAVAYREEKPVYRSRRVLERSCDEHVECDDSPCPAKVRVMREPVEVVYRKTKYTTVYQPKTYKDISYVREPYAVDYNDRVEVSVSSETEEDDDYLE